MINNFDNVRQLIESYIEGHKITGVDIVTQLHESSINDEDKKNISYVYSGSKNLDVIDMDLIAKDVYKQVKDSKEKPINTADAFLVDNGNEWFFIEFKDTEIKADKKSLKDNIIKKAYANWYMLLDILYEMRDKESSVNFDYNNPMVFAKNNVTYIVVCSCDKNPNVYKQIKSCQYSNENYTPVFMQRLKDYLFKDAYIYTDDYFERLFVNKFVY